MRHIYNLGITPICSVCGMVMISQPWRGDGKADIYCATRKCKEYKVLYRIELPELQVKRVGNLDYPNVRIGQ
jgi:hypothetical protein